jgi:ankyrin repeat protein
MFASFEGHVSVVIELLKEEKLDVNFQDIDGDTALILATGAGHKEIVLELLKATSLDVTLQNIYGETAMDLAMSNGHSEIVKCLSERIHGDSHHVETETRDSNSEATQLRDCDALLIPGAGAGKVDDACDLWEKGASINDVDGDGCTALMRASERGHVAIVLKLAKSIN